MEFSWPMVGAISTIIAGIGFIALAWLRSTLIKDFTPNSAFAALAQKVGQMETDLHNAPKHSDMQGLSDRVRAVEVAVAGMQATVAAVQESTARIDRGVTRIEQHLLENGK